MPCEDSGCVLFDEQLGAGGTRILAGAVAKKRRWCAVFDKTAKNRYNFIIASEGGYAKQVLSALIEKLSARGGGTGGMVQGSVEALPDEIQTLLKNISD